MSIHLARSASHTAAAAAAIRLIRVQNPPDHFYLISFFLQSLPRLLLLLVLLVLVVLVSDGPLLSDVGAVIQFQYP